MSDGNRPFVAEFEAAFPRHLLTFDRFKCGVVKTISCRKIGDKSVSEQPARVFISYSHDDADHCDRVLKLAQQLRRDGVEAEIDQFP